MVDIIMQTHMVMVEEEAVDQVNELKLLLLKMMEDLIQYMLNLVTLLMVG